MPLDNDDAWLQGTTAAPPAEARIIHQSLWDPTIATDMAEKKLGASEDLTVRTRLLAGVKGHSGAR